MGTPDVVEGERAIRALVAEFRAGWNAHDAARLSAVFAEDADFTNYRGERARGRVGVRTFHAAMFEGTFRETVLSVDGLAIRSIGEGVASVDVWWSMTGARNDDGALRPPRRGLMALLVTHSDAGPWQILVFHNLEVPRSAPGPA
ncbi:MAG: SgcJ/EcaC family oxidoreductase [Thermoplasmata archaeon]|nr:SgcJ/EcaC family oxidoreductase [Thermoplasmata archaeon]